jgi:hypothetical protein
MEYLLEPFGVREFADYSRLGGGLFARGEARMPLADRERR